jgi:hypothetical protein
MPPFQFGWPSISLSPQPIRSHTGFDVLGERASKATGAADALRQRSARNCARIWLLPGASRHAVARTQSDKSSLCLDLSSNRRVDRVPARAKSIHFVSADLSPIPS